MSTSSEPLNGQSELFSSGKLPTAINDKLMTVTRLARRTALVKGAAITTSITLLTLLGIVAVGALFGLNSIILRWLLCLVFLSACASSVYFFVIRQLFQKVQLLDAAFRIESANPGMEERLTSTVQLVSQQSRESSGSGQLINALTTEAVARTAIVDPEEVPNGSSLPFVAVAASIVTVALISVLLWPQLIVTSLANLATPWKEPSIPALSVSVEPGNVSVAFGSSVSIDAVFEDAMHDPILETIAKDGAIQLHSMAIVAVDRATFTLENLTESVSYRIRSGKRYSNEFNIAVHPKPRLVRVHGVLEFPEYTGLHSVELDQIDEPISVPVGTEIKIRAEADLACRDGWLEVDGKKLSGTPTDDEQNNVESGCHSFEWTLVATDQTGELAVLQLVSNHEVPTEPFRIKILAQKDTPPSARIVRPAVRQLKLRRTDSLPLDFEVTDDYGISKVETLVQFEGKEPLVQSCPASKWKAIEKGAWAGATEFDFSAVPPSATSAKIWLRVSDNLPLDLGGHQTADSEAILIEFDEDPKSLGEQQIESERELIEQSISESIRQLQTASGKLDEAANQKEGSVNNEDRLSKEQLGQIYEARQKIKAAKEKLEELAQQLVNKSNLFEPFANGIQQIAEEDLSNALVNASEVPLSDRLQEQVTKSEKAKEEIGNAIDKLEQLRSRVNDRADQMNVAAQLDELAKQQQHLADNANSAKNDETVGKKDPTDSDPVDKNWSDAQKEVADEIQELVAQDEDAVRRQLLEQANDAERLSKEAAALGKQQEELGNLPKDFDRQPKAEQQRARKKLKELIAAEQDAVKNSLQDDAKNAKAKADRENSNEPLADAREQMKQTAKNLRNEKSDQEAEKSADQALEQLNEAIKSKPAAGNNVANDKQNSLSKTNNDRPQSELKDVAEQQKNIRDAIQALNENDLGRAANKLQEQIANRADKLSQKAKRLADRNHTDPQAERDAERAARQLQNAKQKAEKAIRPAKQAQVDKMQDEQPGETKPQSLGENKKTNSPENGNGKETRPNDQPKSGKQKNSNAKKQASKSENNKSGKQKQPAKQEQQDSADSLKKAAESLNSVCKNCQNCAQSKNGSSPSSSGGKGGESQPKQDQPKPGQTKAGQPSEGQSKKGQQKDQESKSPAKAADPAQLAKAADATKDAANSSTRKDAARSSQKAANQLNKLADEAARKTGYSNRDSQDNKDGADGKRSDSGKNSRGENIGDENIGNEKNGEQKKGGPSSEQGQSSEGKNKQGKSANGAKRGAADEDINGKRLRGSSTSNWTRSRRKLENGVLDDKDSVVPEQYRDVVEQYFEELARRGAKKN